jgi:dimethylargininase
MRYAICRRPGRNFAQGLTSARLGTAAFELIEAQHGAYLETLQALGLSITTLEPLAEHPDAYFVEDTAVVTPHIAVITRPGAPQRRGEEDSIARVLQTYLPTARIQAPGRVDGGDVLRVGNHLFIGISQRTNREGARQLADLLRPHGYRWTPVPVKAGLHLKSSVNRIDDHTLILTEAFATREEFKRFSKIVVDRDEAYAANSLRVNEALITPAGFPGTRRKLEPTGLKVIALDMSEVRKMDGGLTCLSIRF